MNNYSETTVVNPQPAPALKLADTVLQQHYRYLAQNDFSGWDIFDGLNSKIFQKSPFHRSRIARLAWVQLFKKSPVNFRRLVGVPRSKNNPKALALFISGLLNMARVYALEEYADQAQKRYRLLQSLRSPNYSGNGWGYDFPWQARAFYVPAFKPNMVVSTFVGHALLDLFEYFDKATFLNEAAGISEFILTHGILSETADNLCFRYIPGEDAIIHNANLLGAGFLSRLYDFTGEEALKEKAQKAVRFSVQAQRKDGAWVYGNRGHHQWVDNFHTGYNLLSIYRYQTCCRDLQFERALSRGINYHLRHHFTKELLPKFSDTRLYPLDIHCYSQAILTALTLRDYWPDPQHFTAQMIHHAIERMFDPSKGYFYYQQHKFYTNKIAYIRWSQAWMFYALSFYLKACAANE